MTKQDLETRFAQYNQEQVALASEVQQKSALIQQLEGKKQLCQEMHQILIKAEAPAITVLPDPPKDESPAETPAQ